MEFSKRNGSANTEFGYFYIGFSLIVKGLWEIKLKSSHRLYSVILSLTYSFYSVNIGLTYRI